jgi:hypothetical protein
MSLSIVLVFWGTMAQVHLGTYNAQKIFFNSFIVLQKIGTGSLYLKIYLVAPTGANSPELKEITVQGVAPRTDSW